VASPPQPVFYYDLGSPLCYLAAERIVAELPVLPEWEPVFDPDLGASAPVLDRDEIALQARACALQPIRWPERWPPDTRTAMLTATYAKRIGRVVAFSLAAFRQAFAGGRDLTLEDTVLIAAAACEMHPTAVLKAVELKATADALTAAGTRALTAGVASLPAVQVGHQVFEGDRAVEDAVARLEALT
jgi:2-hydroxychromene-2-carboxylate isomerase